MSHFQHPLLPPGEGRPLLVVGASARAAAESARRAGFLPYAIDLFADADLAEVAEVQLSRDFPYDIPSLARRVPACDWLYVGGLENYPTIVDALAAERRLLGNSGDSLRRVRDPRLLRDELCRHGIAMPESIFDRAELARRLAASERPEQVGGGQSWPESSAGWLLKRYRSSAGLGVAPCPSDRIDSTFEHVFDGSRYLQRHIVGRSIGAVYLATRSCTELLGASYQLTCPSRAQNLPFRYAGSVGGLNFSAPGETQLVDNLRGLGSLVTSVFPLSGIFSLDFILDAGSRLQLLEVNPRYTAGCELIERGLGKSLVGLHSAACRDEIAGEIPLIAAVGGVPMPRWQGKKVVYADQDIAQVTDDMSAALLARRDADRQREGWSSIADIPRPGTSIRRDDPIATVFASGVDELAVHEELDRRERELRSLLNG